MTEKDYGEEKKVVRLAEWGTFAASPSSLAPMESDSGMASPSHSAEEMMQVAASSPSIISGAIASTCKCEVSFAAKERSMA